MFLYIPSPSGKLNINMNRVEEILDYLNQKANQSFKATTEKTKSLINARMNEGFTVEDFKTVIDIKCNEWLGSEKMEIYLRPETLFGTKFEGYLNQEGGRPHGSNENVPKKHNFFE